MVCVVSITWHADICGQGRPPSSAADSVPGLSCGDGSAVHAPLPVRSGVLGTHKRGNMSAQGKEGALQLWAPGRPPAPGWAARLGRNPHVVCIRREREPLRKSAVKQAPPLPVYTTAANATTTAAASLSAATTTTSSPSHRRCLVLPAQGCTRSAHSLWVSTPPSSSAFFSGR